MITISPQTLTDLGIDLPSDKLEELLDHLQDTLEKRIGEEVVSFLTSTQLDEYLKLQETSDLEAQSKWLKKALPDLDEIVEDEYNILLGEVATDYQKFMPKETHEAESDNQTSESDPEALPAEDSGEKA